MSGLRYPIGPFVRPDSPSSSHDRAARVEVLAHTPTQLRAAIEALSDEQVSTPYRPGGWTVRQTVHHVPDSHMNAYTRCKLALTEDEPTIKPTTRRDGRNWPTERQHPSRCCSPCWRRCTSAW